MAALGVEETRWQAEQRLRESETKFRTLFDNTSDAIFLMNETVFLSCNRRTEAIFGCAPGQIIGQSPVQFSPARQPNGCSSAEKAGEYILRAFAGAPQFFEWQFQRLDGTTFHAGSQPESH